MDWAAEKKRIEDAANQVRNNLDLARLQVRELENEMLRLEGEYRFVTRMHGQPDVKTEVTAGDGPPGSSAAQLEAEPAPEEERPSC